MKKLEKLLRQCFRHEPDDDVISINRCRFFGQGKLGRGGCFETSEKDVMLSCQICRELVRLKRAGKGE